MPVRLNHTIVHCRDKHASARYLAEMLGLGEPSTFGPFVTVQVANDVSLDYADGRPVHPQHYAFLVSEAEFDEILARIVERQVPYWADPYHHRPGEVNHNDGGRGAYWDDPDGHSLEILTRPYGSGG
ncbi:MAG: VOC family protein [Acidimicrobiales bacterium]